MFKRAVLSLCQSVLSRHDAELVRTPRLKSTRRAHTRSHDDAELFERALGEYSHSKTRGDFVRFFMLFTQARRVIREGIEGDFAEVGVYKGLTAKVLLRCCEERTLHLFDTFEGHPPNADEEQDGAEYVRMVEEITMSDTSLEGVRATLSDASNVEFHPGYFPATAKELEGDRFAFVHLDGDQYRTILDGLEFFYPRTSSQGVIVCHDYGIYQGVRSAVDEFLADRPEVAVELPDASGSVLIVKSVGPSAAR
jgi:O-methyltransferase